MQGPTKRFVSQFLNFITKLGKREGEKKGKQYTLKSEEAGMHAYIKKKKAQYVDNDGIICRGVQSTCPDTQAS